MVVEGTPITGAAGTTLAFEYSDLYAEVSDYMGWGRSPTGDRLSEVQRHVNAGYRKFLLGMDPRTQRAHQWSFLMPTATIVFWATVTGTVDGTPSHNAGTSTITATAASFYASMVGRSFTFDTSGTEYTITGYSSTTQITVSGDASGETADDTFTITADGLYGLPNDFGSILEGFSFSSTANASRMCPRSAKLIRDMAAGAGAVSAAPQVYDILPREYDQTQGQRHNVLVWPIPGSTYTMHYRYRVHTDELDGADDLPIGGPDHAATIEACCLAEAELRAFPGETAHQKRADMMMAASIDQDARLKPSNLGYNGDDSDSQGPGYDRRGEVSYP